MERPLERSQESMIDSQAPGQAGCCASEPLRAAEEVRAVLTISRALGGKLDLDHVLGVAVREVAEVVGAEGSSVLAVDPETGGMSFHVAAGPGSAGAKTVALPPGAGICGHVVRSGEPLIVNDTQKDPRFYRQVDLASGITTRNLLCVPLSCDGRLWGVMELINKCGGSDFNQADLRLAEVVGVQIALALSNAWLHAEIVQKERAAAVGQTVSGLAHCIKNILNGIRAGSAVVDRCLRSEDFDEVRRGWGIVRKNNNMLSNLVLDMLSLAQDSGSHPFPTDVNELAEQICQLLTERARNQGVTIVFTPAPGLGEVRTDPTQFYRCLLNLVSNAVEACEEGNSVRVRVCRAGQRPRFTISVLDDGMGIAPEHRDRLFREFFTTKGSAGTGLGLPVTKKLITAMGGTLTFHSVVGRGTRFVMALPTDSTPTKDKEPDS